MKRLGRVRKPEIKWMKSTKIQSSAPVSVKLSVFDERGKSFRALDAKREMLTVHMKSGKGEMMFIRISFVNHGFTPENIT